MFFACMGMSGLICAIGLREGTFMHKNIDEALKMEKKRSRLIQGISSFLGTPNEPLDHKS